MSTEFEDWFDVEDKFFLKSYDHLLANGSWTQEFLDRMKHDYVHFPCDWYSIIAAKIINAFLVSRLMEED